MKRIHKIVAGATGALSLVLAAAVAAAPGGPGGPQGGYQGMGPMGYGMMHGGGMHGGMYGHGPGAMSTEYLAQLKTRLVITATQEPAWQAFAAKVAEQASLMQATHEQHHAAAAADTPAPDRMTQHMATMSQHLAGMQGVNAAFRDLYAVLTPEQRTIADQSFGPMGPRGFGGHMHG